MPVCRWCRPLSSFWLQIEAPPGRLVDSLASGNFRCGLVFWFHFLINSFSTQEHASFVVEGQELQTTSTHESHDYLMRYDNRLFHVRIRVDLTKSLLYVAVQCTSEETPPYELVSYFFSCSDLGNSVRNTFKK